MLESVPCLNPTVRWQELESGEMMGIYKRHTHGIARFLTRLLHTSEIGQVLLDETGSAVVRAIDGKRTVSDLIAHFAEHLHLSRKESEVSLLKFMEMLARRRLIGFAVSPPEGEAT